MKKIIKLFLFLFLVNSSFAQLSREWTRLYHNYVDHSYQVIVFQDYIYVFGDAMRATYDYEIIKYTQDGGVVWAHTYDVIHYFYGSIYDSFIKATIDDNGNLYVTGISSFFGGDCDISIIKVSPDGQLLWSGVYPGGEGDEGPTDIKVLRDGILLVASGWYSGASKDILILKISFDGVTMWEERFRRDLFTVNGEGKAYILNNDLYISGFSSYPNSYADDIVLLKYGFGSGQSWIRYFDIYEDDSKGYDIAGDDSYLYVVGAGKTTVDYAIILKYDFNGNLIWYRFYQVPYPPGIFPHIKLDNENIYVIYSTDATGRVIKYNKNGDFLWARTQGSTWLPSFDIDNRYIYTCGYGESGIVKVYDLDGNDVFYDYEPGLGRFYYILKNNNNVITTGEFYIPEVLLDAITIKYNVQPEGDFELSRPISKLVYSNTEVTDKNNLTKPKSQMFTGFDSCDSSSSIGPFGEIYRTTNNGLNWYVIGKSKEDGDSKLSVNDDNTSTIPDKFKLSQNYPNPFNPNTHLRIEIPELRYVRLTVFDILGREITTLVNQQLSPGKYEVEFNAENYPSGVYYYRLTSGNYSETKKMILLR